MKNLKKDLAELKTLSGNDFKKKAAEIKNKYTEPAEMDEIHAFISAGFDEIEQDLTKIKAEVLVRKQIEDVAQFVNLSYIAKTYFNKSKTWLSQRINGNIVSGKPRYLSDKDKETLNFALRDMAQRLSSLKVS